MPDDHEFVSFYHAAYARLVVQLFAVTGNLHDAKDLAQEAFARAVVHGQRLRASDVPAAWVRRVG
jgi:RNA polymerase sigma-70 factor, ECF subfamily